MEKMLLISQNKMDTWFVNGISIGKRDPRIIVGTKIKELLEKKGVEVENWVTGWCENSYRESLKRVLDNQEIPKEKLFDKICKYFDVDKEYFYDKQLKNVIVNDSRLIVAEYDTDERAKDVKREMDVIIEECYRNGQPIILKLPEA